MTEQPIRQTSRRRQPADRHLTGVYFTRQQVERLDRLAESNDVSRCLLIRRAVDRLLEDAGV